MHHPTDRIGHTTAFVTPVVKHWLEPFTEMRDRYRDYITIYTDGSRGGNSVACATVFPSNTVIFITLPDLLLKQSF